MVNFQHLHQLNNVEYYINQFETWMSLLRRDNQYLPEYFLILRFISGLKDSVKHMVKCHKHPTLISAYEYSRDVSLVCIHNFMPGINLPLD